MKRILLLAGIGLGIYAISMGSNSVNYAGNTDLAYGKYTVGDTIPKKDTSKPKKRDTTTVALATMPVH